MFSKNTGVPCAAHGHCGLTMGQAATACSLCDVTMWQPPPTATLAALCCGSLWWTAHVCGALAFWARPAAQHGDRNSGRLPQGHRCQTHERRFTHAGHSLLPCMGTAIQAGYLRATAP